MLTQVRMESLKGRDYSEDLGIDGWIILKWPSIVFPSKQCCGDDYHPQKGKVTLCGLELVTEEMQKKAFFLETLHCHLISKVIFCDIF
jgi:hypothetical protein